MRKVIFAEYGGPDVLQLADTDTPHAGPHEVRIAVRAAGVNAADWRLREGQFSAGQPIELPVGVGLEASGVVDEIGEGVTGVELGDHVFGMGSETYAEHAVLSSWARMPEGLTFETAAGYASVGEASLRILDQVGVQPGQTLLVSGASGGVGSTVLQIAKDRGISVIGTASADNLDYLRSLGATATTYGDGWVERVTALGTIDAALDLAGSGVIPQLVELTGDPDRVLSIADLSAPEHGVRLSLVPGPVQEALDVIVELISRGALYTPVEQSYTLAEAASAHVDSQAGHSRGRRIMVP